MRKFSKFVLFLLLVVIISTGCEDNVDKKPTPTQEIEKEYPVLIDGNYIKKQPEKLVSLSPMITQIIYDLELSKKIAATVEYEDMPQTFFGRGIGSMFDIKENELKRLDYDIIFTQSPISLELKYDSEQREISVINLENPTNFAEFNTLYQTIYCSLYGNKTGKKFADLYVNDYIMKIYSIQKQILEKQNDVEDEKKTVAYILEKDFIAATDGCIESEYLYKIGLRNVAIEAKNYEYSFESLLLDDPYYLVLGMGVKLEDITKDEQYQKLTAVKEGRIIDISKTPLERYNNAAIEGLKQIAQRVYGVEDIKVGAF